METKEDLLARLYALHRFGIKPGLERINALLEKVGSPHRSLECVHVAGTNGKGSVSSLIAAATAAAGIKTGLYTSPHIQRFNERIKVNGKEIADEDMLRLISSLLDASKGTETTFFEITTALALLYFVEQGVELAVIESGMGGINDATNVITPTVAVITNVELEHTDYLGSTVEEIALDKAGIIKPGIKAIIGEKKRAASEVIRKYAEEAGAQALFAESIVKIEDKKYFPDLTIKGSFSFENGCDLTEFILPDLKVGLAGTIQFDNASCALAALGELAKTYPVTLESIMQGFADVKSMTGLRGRMDLLRAEPPLIADCAHNPAAAAAVVRTLIEHGLGDVKYDILFSAMSDKDINGTLKTLAPICGNLIAARPRTPRAELPGNIVSMARSLGYIHAESAPSMVEGVAKLIEWNRPALVVGSFYLLEDALPLLISQL
ncbi:MAG: bifunctional folylpolyglutamate synthase/dihydrofolate synthase [Chloroflexota bacterium]